MKKINIKDFEYNDFEHIRRNGSKWCRFIGFDYDEIKLIDINNFENYKNKNFKKILKNVILFKEKYCYNVLFISINHNNELKWLLQTPSYGMNKINSEEFGTCKKFIDEIIKKNPNTDDLLKHWFFTINPDYILMSNELSH